MKSNPEVPLNYRGWRITAPYHGPLSGFFFAESHGVRLSNSTWERLKEQIDLRPLGLPGYGGPSSSELAAELKKVLRRAERLHTKIARKWMGENHETNSPSF